MENISAHSNSFIMRNDLPSSSSSFHHHLAKMELGHLLTRSSLTHLEVSVLVSPGFFCLIFCSILVFSVIYYGVFCLYFATHLFCIPVLCLKLALYLLMCSLSLSLSSYGNEKILLAAVDQYPER
jgi:hypothetical protein